MSANAIMTARQCGSDRERGPLDARLRLARGQALAVASSWASDDLLEPASGHLRVGDGFANRFRRANRNQASPTSSSRLA